MRLLDEHALGPLVGQRLADLMRRVAGPHQLVSLEGAVLVRVVGVVVRRVRGDAEDVTRLRGRDASRLEVGQPAAVLVEVESGHQHLRRGVARLLRLEGREAILLHRLQQAARLRGGVAGRGHRARRVPLVLRTLGAQAAGAQGGERLANLLRSVAGLQHLLRIEARVGRELRRDAARPQVDEGCANLLLGVARLEQLGRVEARFLRPLHLHLRRLLLPLELRQHGAHLLRAEAVQDELGRGEAELARLRRRHAARLEPGERAVDLLGRVPVLRELHHCEVAALTRLHHGAPPRLERRVGRVDRG